MDGAADVAETTCAPFQSEHAAGAAHCPAGEAHSRFPTGPLRQYRARTRLHHRPGRGTHAEVENAIRDLKWLNHMPSGFRRQRRLAGDTGWRILARWSADRSQVVDPPAAVLRPRRTNHPLGPPPQKRWPWDSRPWPDCEPFHSRLTAPLLPANSRQWRVCIDSPRRRPYIDRPPTSHLPQCGHLVQAVLTIGGFGLNGTWPGSGLSYTPMTGTADEPSPSGTSTTLK